MNAVDDLTRMGRTCLLTLPRSDFETTAAAATSNSDSLLLLQLPVGWSPADLKGAKFVAQKASNSDEKMPASLVSEHKASSFSIQRVETSNCLIMIPPPTSIYDNPTESNIEESSTKRAKVIAPVPARLLNRGGAGASFLELRLKTVSKHKVEEVFQKNGHVFNPLDHENHNINAEDGGCSRVKGICLETIAMHLQVSISQVAEAMGIHQPSPISINSVFYYPLPNTQLKGYVIVSEEAYLEAYQAILAALAETGELADYAQGISREKLIQSALERFQLSCTSKEEHLGRRGGISCLPGGVPGLISFCVDRLERTPCRESETEWNQLEDADTHITRLDVIKVAKVVARQLFQRQTAPWEETKLLQCWQAELPGVGEEYQVATSMLQGVAVSLPGCVEEENLWKYLPPSAVPLDESVGFTTLFDVKDKWSLEELQPFLERWSDAAGCSHADLLLLFTKAITEDRNGGPVKLFTCKK